MRLFLSSENLGKYPNVFVSMIGDNKKLAFTENAKDDWPAKDRQAKFQEHKDQFEALGLDVTELDLRDFFNKPKELEKFLSDFRAFKYSGLDKLLKKRLKEDNITYGGSSAGSIIMTPDLHGVERGDRPRVVPSSYKSEIIWEGLGIVPFYIVPHYESDWFKDEAADMKDYYDKRKLDYYTLHDGQAVLIEGEKIKLLP
jgi:dipeptidase E